MLDIKFIRENPERVKKELHNRGGALIAINIDQFLEMDKAERFKKRY